MCFLVEAAEALPGPLADAASLVTIDFPWGSLLRGMLGMDPATLRGVASIVSAGGSVEILASIVPSDHVDGLEALDLASEPRAAAAWRAIGFELVCMRRATREDVLATRSSWAKRLGDRPACLFRLRCCTLGPDPPTGSA